jgi:hypothetical protein
MDETINMYSIDDNDDINAYETGIQFRQKGLLTEVEIDGKRIQMVSAQAFVSLSNSNRLLKETIRRLDATINQLSRRMTQLEQVSRSISNELDNKVSYE